MDNKQNDARNSILMRHYPDFDSSPLNVESTQWNAIFSDLILRINVVLSRQYGGMTFIIIT